MAHKLFATSYLKLWFITFKAIFPYLFKFYELPFLADDVEKYFFKLTDRAINLRNESIEKPDDYLNFLLKLKKKRNLENVDVAQHSITFFLDAYETSSIILTHALYRLAQNKNCQIKLRQEIAECNGNINFDVISNLKYLDQVLNGKCSLSSFLYFRSRLPFCVNFKIFSVLRNTSNQSTRFHHNKSMYRTN